MLGAIWFCVKSISNLRELILNWQTIWSLVCWILCLSNVQSLWGGGYVGCVFFPPNLVFFIWTILGSWSSSLQVHSLCYWFYCICAQGMLYPEWPFNDTCIKSFLKINGGWWRFCLVFQHHCRNCGDIFCDKCTKGRTALTADQNAPVVRVCDRCMVKLLLFNCNVSGNFCKCGTLHLFLPGVWKYC